MAKQSSPPTVEPDAQHGQKFSHPSYAVVKINRCSGQVELFDSSFTHQHFISLSISPATKHTDGSHDFIFGSNKDLIEVWMSETQFARAITSMNMGSGSPCTLNRFDGKNVDAPEREDLLNTHTEMVKTKLTEVMDAQSSLGNQIVEWREAGHRPTLKEMDWLASRMHLISSNFASNMAFYAGCFQEHMEAVVDEAKTELETHMLASADKLGLDKQPVIGFQDKVSANGALDVVDDS